MQHSLTTATPFKSQKILFKARALGSNLIHRRLSTSQLPILDPPSPVTWFTSFLLPPPTPSGIPPSFARFCDTRISSSIIVILFSLSVTCCFHVFGYAVRSDKVRWHGDWINDMRNANWSTGSCRATCLSLKIDLFGLNVLIPIEPSDDTSSNSFFRISCYSCALRMHNLRKDKRQIPWEGLFTPGLSYPRVSSKFDFRYESLRSKPGPWRISCSLNWENKTYKL